MLQGSLVAIVTPMHEDGSLDLERFKALIDFHIREGTNGSKRPRHIERGVHRVAPPRFTDQVNVDRFEITLRAVVHSNVDTPIAASRRQDSPTRDTDTMATKDLPSVASAHDRRRLRYSALSLLRRSPTRFARRRALSIGPATR